MNFFSQSGPEVVYKTEKPAFCQSDGCKVNPRLRNYIMRGEPCEYDKRLRNSFESRTNESVFKVVMMIAGFIVAVIILTLSAVNDTLKDPLSLWLIILACFLAYIIYCIHRNKINLLTFNAAKRGDIQCFRYKVRRFLKCHVDCSDNPDYYYADFDDFCVDIPSIYHGVEYLFGAVITINGEEYFYLLR